jgi:DNA modification methylase
MDHGDIGIAARKLGRKFIGIEKDNERFNAAHLRMKRELDEETWKGLSMIRGLSKLHD